jgi:FkbH-like protein
VPGDLGGKKGEPLGGLGFGRHIGFLGLDPSRWKRLISSGGRSFDVRRRLGTGESLAADIKAWPVKDYLFPKQLSVTDMPVGSVQLIGNCVFDGWLGMFAQRHPEMKVDHVLVEYLDEAGGAADYDLRLVQIPLRILYPEYYTMQIAYDDVAGHERAFAEAVRTMRKRIALVPGGDPDRPTFFLNYAFPQRTAMGRLMPRYDLRNPIFFIQRLNRELSDLVDQYPGGHILDIEQISASFGRRFVQDDAFWSFSHGGFISDFDALMDGERLEAETPLSQRYRLDVQGVIGEMWDEAVAMLRTLRGIDRVKMVCVDLDDTLWRGVLAERDDVDYTVIEGWPLGLAEALIILRNRGILLGIISKNDEATALDLIRQAFWGRLKPEDFAVRKINWRSKADNLREAIAEVNILPDAVVYIDDNPVERARIEEAFPEVRTLGAPHLDWRRILLWSAETQVPAISEESARRTEMVQAQLRRERERSETREEDFLSGLNVRIRLGSIDDVGSPYFARALELINKTNQFNTTGVRWIETEAAAYFATGGRWWIFFVEDRFTAYGLVGVVVQSGLNIDQFVMSCRVFGLGVEQSALNAIRAREPMIATATLVETPRNGPCRLVYRSAGWVMGDDGWRPAWPPGPHANVEDIG